MLTILIPASLLALFTCSVAVGYFAERKDKTEAQAASTYRAIVRRNGVTAPIPFSSPDSIVNAPGLVEVQPRSRTVASTEAPTEAITPPDHLPVKTVDSQQVSAASARPQLPTQPVKISPQPTEEEGEVIVELWESGYSMTKIIRAVWGVKPGGSKAYAAARERYKHYLKDIS